MVIVTLLLFVPFTVAFVAVSIGCIAYISIGMKQWLTGNKEPDRNRRRNGAVAVLFSLAIWLIAFYLYFTYVWLW